MFDGTVTDGNVLTTINNAYIFGVTHNTIVSYIIYYHNTLSQYYHEKITVTVQHKKNFADFTVSLQSTKFISAKMKRRL